MYYNVCHVLVQSSTGCDNIINNFPVTYHNPLKI